jgi:RNA polymerase sigma-70 factor, ECF subfamily
MRPNTHHRSPPAADWDWDHARRVCLRAARRLLPNEADAEEAVQEAMARAWRKRHQCRAAPVPWLLGITRNEALRIAASRREFSPLEDAAEHEDPSPADDVLRRVQVGHALDRLGAADRELLELRYTADLTQSAVAERVGIPEGTVKVRLHRLRNQLRTALMEAQ